MSGLHFKNRVFLFFFSLSLPRLPSRHSCPFSFSHFLLSTSLLPLLPASVIYFPFVRRAADSHNNKRRGGSVRQYTAGSALSRTWSVQTKAHHYRSQEVHVLVGGRSVGSNPNRGSLLPIPRANSHELILSDPFASPPRLSAPTDIAIS